MNTKEIATQVQIKEYKEPDQHIIINGQQGTVPGQEHTIFVCPRCGDILIDVPQEIPEVYRGTIIPKLDLTGAPIYCPNCGQKLDYDVASVIEGEILEVREEEIIW